MQAKAYSDIQDSSLSVSVSGDTGEAKVFQSNELDKSGMWCNYEKSTLSICSSFIYLFIYQFMYENKEKRFSSLSFFLLFLFFSS